jgi:hypothetical protein
MKQIIKFLFFKLSNREVNKINKNQKFVTQSLGKRLQVIDRQYIVDISCGRRCQV